ncbi:MAG: chorismate synthase [Flavobacteriales bacterium]
MYNTFGTLFKLHSYGESHGSEIGGIIDGCPANFKLDFDAIQAELDRRKPGQSELTTSRKEADQVEFQSGIFEGKTTGTPIHFRIKNKDQRSKDYGNLSEVFRPSHADFTYQKKYGNRDFRGGGRASARETACRVVAGAIAKQFLATKGIKIRACVSQIYDKQFTDYQNIEWDLVEGFQSRAAHSNYDKLFKKDIQKAKADGDSLGGVIYTEVLQLPIGLGEPVFQKLHAQLGAAILGINACKGFEIGSGFSSSFMKGSEHNDAFVLDEKQENIRTKTNYSGGVQGGISNGETLYFKAAFKPTATVIQHQKTVDKNLNIIDLEIKGRHDPCVLPRAVPIVEAMTALCLFDALLLHHSRQNF